MGCAGSKSNRKQRESSETATLSALERHQNPLQPEEASSSSSSSSGSSSSSDSGESDGSHEEDNSNWITEDSSAGEIDPDSENALIQVLFTPGDDVTGTIVSHILAAESEVLVQAYSFTSTPILEALIHQHQTGRVRVVVVLDKSQEKQNKQVFKVMEAGLRVMTDYNLRGIAHNKVIIIDRSVVFTGSFNFSKAAQHSNAENSLLIRDTNIVQKYVKNFESRLQGCRPFVPKPKRNKKRYT